MRRRKNSNAFLLDTHKKQKYHFRKHSLWLIDIDCVGDESLCVGKQNNLFSLTTCVLDDNSITRGKQL